MKIYISGPITSMPSIEWAKEKFDEMEARIIAAGHEAVNPMSLSHDHDKSWSAYMREDIIALMGCDAVIVLPNWEKSKGCNVELQLALSIDMPCFILPENYKNTDLLNAINRLLTILSLKIR